MTIFLLQSLYAVLLSFALGFSGRLLLRGFRWPAGAPATACVSFAAGSVAFSFTAMLLAVFHLLKTPLVVALALGAVAAAVAEIALHRNAYAEAFRTQRSALSKDRFLPIIVAAVFLLPAFFYSAAPPTARDALVYHLTTAKNMALSGNMTPIRGNVYSNFPQGVEMIYAVLYKIFGDRACALYHWLCALFAFAGLFTLAKEKFGSRTALFSALVLISAPTAMVVSGTAYVDLTLCLAIVAAIAVFSAFRATGEENLALLAGALGGFTVAIKYTGLAYAAIFTVFFIIISTKTEKMSKKTFFGFVLLGLAVGAPYLIRNLINNGNPVFPFIFKLFEGRGWDIGRARAYNEMLGHFGFGEGFVNAILFPVNAALFGKFGSMTFDGVLGPFFLLAMVTILFAKPWEKGGIMSELTIGVLMAVVFFLSGSHQARFALPALAFIAPLSAATFAPLLDHKKAWIKYGTLSLAALLLAVNFAFGMKELLRINPFAVAVGAETQDHYRGRLIPAWPIYRQINESLPPDAKIFAAMTGNFGYLFERKYYSDSIFEDHMISETLSRTEVPKDYPLLLRTIGFTHVFFDERMLKKALEGPRWEALAEGLEKNSTVIGRYEGFVLLKLNEK